jgi:4,5-dihydroxyphthalate decarboxylase
MTFGEMNFKVLRRPRTQALLDRCIEISGLSASWLTSTDPLAWQLPPSEKRRDLASRELAGGEMSISSFLQAKSRGAPLVALPIFLKRGLVQRSLFCAASSSIKAVEQLQGKKIGLVGFTSSMAVWMRGILHEGYGFDSARCQWFALSGASNVTQSLRLPDEFAPAKLSAWEELDGYEHELDRREVFLVSLLTEGKLDAVVSFQARIDDPRIRPLFDDHLLWSDPLNRKMYPINHLFVVKSDVLANAPQLADGLLRAFGEARRLWTDYLPAVKRESAEKEAAQLGFDPFAYLLGDVEKTTLEAMIRYLQNEELIARHLRWTDLFNNGF